MANWTLTGGLGSGKSIIAVGKLKDFMLAGRPCAGNIDFYPEKCLPFNNKSIYLRLPDFPSSSDLWNLGRASQSKDEKTFGILVLDELAVFLNSRDWSSKGREEFIKYLRHVRKQHWHTLFITQDLESLDKQARIALVEHKAVCSRTDRLPIPIIGGLLKLFGIARMLPRIHIAIVKYGTSDKARKVDTWTYYGKSHFDAYDTDQIFTDAEERDTVLYGYKYITEQTKKFGFIRQNHYTKITVEYPAKVTGAFSTLSAWHVKGRYVSKWAYYKYLLILLLLIFTLIYGVFVFFFVKEPVLKSSQIKPAVISSPVLPAFGSPVNSFFFDHGVYYLKLEDGSHVYTIFRRVADDGYVFNVEGVEHVYKGI
ncbi:MAG: zonular occludens toxin domain-containing protein [Methylophilus sp.]